MTQENSSYPVPSREEFLDLKDDDIQDFVSLHWKKTLKYRLATLADKAYARRKSQFRMEDGKTETEYEKLGAALISRCLVAPEMQPQDIENLMKKNASECERLFNLINGRLTGNP